MCGNAITNVKTCSENDALALAYYLYQMCLDVYSFEAHEECQILYNALVDRLNLQKHSEFILNAMLNKLISTKELTPFEPGDKYRHPYSVKGKLKINFREDDDIYQNSGRWTSDTLKDILFVRALFASSKNDLARIVALTFFTKPESFKDSNAKLPGRITIPANVKKAVTDKTLIQFAVDSLKLTENEAQVLQAAFRTHSTKEMNAVCNDFYRNSEVSRLEMYAKFTGLSLKEIRLLLKTDQKLKAFGLLNEDGEMDQDAMDAIYEKDMRIYFADIVKNEKSLKAYAPESFSVAKDKTDIAVQLLKSSSACNILLYGAPGAGKTEYARTLIKNAGLKLCSYKNDLEVSGKKDGENIEVKALSRLNCYLSMKKEDSVLVVDEAENVLQTKEFSFFGMQHSSPQKGTVNKMLENSENKVIWIVNYTDEMDESTLRRFTYSIKFQHMPKETLRSIAASKLDTVKMPLQLKSDILDLCGKYQITGASVDNVVKAIKALDYEKGKEDKIRADIQSVLEANSSLLYGKKKIRDAVDKSYDLSVLNTSVAAPDIMEMLQAAEENRKSNDISGKDGVRMLFYGMSGTGKTELARYIAETLEKPLLLKRCSDLINPYVGQTEINISKAFEEAETTNSILLIDEADSFFADRQSAKNSWERTMVNEFLTQMEEFSGILICTTNLRSIMDPAMQRRFHIITEFKALNEHGIEVLLNRYFGNFKFEKEQVQNLLKSDSVTPGDFGSLNGRIRFIPGAKLNSEYIVQELLKIQSEKEMNTSHRIGFAV